jgi:hypothetical protein
MIVIASVAVVTAGFEWKRRSDRYRALAEYHAQKSASVAFSGKYEALKRLMARINYHRQMRDKYQRAVCFPWLSVEPDPPEPK